MSVLTLSQIFIAHPRHWFKGQDTVSILAFLDHWLQDPHVRAKVEAEDRPFVKQMQVAIGAANKFMTCLYHSGLWLTDDERDTLLRSGHACVRAFCSCADISFARGITRWKLQPKLHMFGEVLYALEADKRSMAPSISPLAWLTQMDEDFIGKIAFYSRTVSIRTVHRRTLERYQIGLASIW